LAAHAVPAGADAKNCCEKLQVLGVHIDGGMCERIVVPTRKLHRSNQLSLEQLALVETLAIGCPCGRPRPAQGW
jgi:threonine dehydrogenase-like Zn-dependent dehydrogenase